ncbi:MAG: hypothetical protein LKF41_03170 [Bifidobacterium sp.]|jgi:hypothetical protein|nr:hypothetical protein [Bifidobacterium sp.]MCH4174844.1 hypothetical protein [Bifidobacterium sp.]
MSLDDSMRRIANQTLFAKLCAQDDNHVEGRNGEPFDMLTDPDMQNSLSATRRRARQEIKLSSSQV